jgi:Transcriptional regulator, contains sigma factor-related N-terminal domain
MVVQEDEKFEPLLAALKGRFSTHLVLTSRMAKRLLDHANATQSKDEATRATA